MEEQPRVKALTFVRLGGNFGLHKGVVGVGRVRSKSRLGLDWVLVRKRVGLKRGPSVNRSEPQGAT